MRGWLPRSFQARLTMAVVAVIALTLGLVTVLVINRLDDYFTNQQVADLRVRSSTVSVYVRGLVEERAGARPVVGADGLVDPAVVATMNDPVQRELIADRLGQADVTIRFGFTQDDGQAPRFIASPN
ncbi:MAG: hypothetical protein WKF56_07255, partial [Candidatus Limnocylindrales bacterium]